MKARWSWISFGAGILLAGVAIGGPFIGYAVEQDRHARYTECLAGHGFFGQPITDDQIDAIAAAAEDCISR